MNPHEAGHSAPRAHSALSRPIIWLVVGSGILWGLGQIGVVDRRPPWLLLALVFTAGALSLIGDRSYRLRPAPPTVHVRIASQAIGVTVLVYVLGWGPALAIGYGAPILSNAFRLGSRHRWALALWPAASLLLAQLVVDLAGVRLLVPARTADGLAAVDIVALTVGSLFVARLVAGKELAERRLSHAASHDALTGLMNRASFVRRLELRLSGDRRAPATGPADRGHSGVAVLFCDLVGFKAVNDKFGHDAGDLALAEVARRLELTVREGDLLARFAGDEFVVGLCPLSDAADAVTMARRLVEALEWPVLLHGLAAQLGVSIGIFFSASGRVPVDEMLADADAAMYEAKSLRRSAWTLFEVA